MPEVPLRRRPALDSRAMSIARHALPVLTALALVSCNKEGPSALDQMRGTVLLSTQEFESARGFKTLEEVKRGHPTVSELTVNVPGAALKYYGGFKEPLAADRYVVEEFDRTENTVAHTERRDEEEAGTT